MYVYVIMCIQIYDLWCFCIINCILLLIITVNMATFYWLLNVWYNNPQLVAKYTILATNDRTLKRFRSLKFLATTFIATIFIGR
jgi:hypothetical protein